MLDGKKFFGFHPVIDQVPAKKIKR
jgi:hypothetical protein